MRPLLLLLGALALTLWAACADGAADTPPSTPGATTGTPTETPTASSVVPYRLDRPDAIVELPPVLREISALSALPNGRLAAVQDETGVLYELDPTTGAIVSQEPFRTGGDFEGVERLDDAMWILKSNGDLYRVRRADGDSVEVVVVETPLSSRNDTEGLAYDAANHRLLIVCKEHPGNGLGDVRAIYGFDLATETLSDAPLYTLDQARLDAADGAFKPAALAVRPGTGEIYVVSSVRKALVVLAPDGTLRAVVDLPPALYAQPEGLAFTPDGTLFISNEGPDGPATLLRFGPSPD